MKTLCILLLFAIQTIHAESIYEGIKVDRKSHDILGFTIQITQNDYQKNCYNIKVIAPKNGKNKSTYAYSQVLIEKKGKSILNIRPHSWEEINGKHEFSFVIDRNEFKNLAINVIYQLKSKPIENPKDNSITYGGDPEEFSYEIILKDFITKKK